MRNTWISLPVVILLAIMTILLSGCGIFEAWIEAPETPEESETPDLPEPSPGETTDPGDTPTEEIDSPEVIEAGPGGYAYAWYGRIVSLPLDSQYDDFLSVEPQGLVTIGIEGETEQIAQQIIDLRDKPAPGNYAHFWGTLICPAIDYGGCQLRVDSLRIDEPGRILEPVAIEGWVGTIHTGRTEPGSGGDDYFQLEGDFAIQYGIWASSDLPEELGQQIEDLRDTGIQVRVWGWLVTGVPDWNATQLQVNRLEILP